MSAKFAIPTGAATISSIDYGSSPFPWIIIKLTELKTLGIGALVILTGIIMAWNRKIIVSEDKKVEEAERNSRVEGAAEF